MSKVCCSRKVNDGGGTLYTGAIRSNRLHVQDDTISNEGYIQDLGVDTFEAGGQIINDIDDDGTMAANSDSRLVTQKSVVTYVTNSIAAAFPDAVNLRFVGKHGNDANDGLIWEEAKLTIANCLLAISSGDVIVILDAGVYSENINITTGKEVYMPNATLTGNVTLSNGARLNVGTVNSSTGTTFSLNAASSIAHVDAHEVYCTGTANMAVCNNGELNLHINHVEINTGDVVAETNSDRIFAEFGTIIVKGAGADIFATSLGASVCATIKCIREDGGTGTLFKGTPAGAAYINILAGSISLTNLSNINASAICRLNASNLTGALNELGAGTAVIGPPWLKTTSAIELALGANITEFSIDGTMAGNSDVAVPTEKAVKTYSDAHATSDGSSHTFINQNVTTTGTPTFVSINLGDTTLSTYKQATHSVTWTGIWAADQNKTLYYTIIGNTVTMRFEFFMTAVNASNHITNTAGTFLPAEIRPATEINCHLHVIDNTVIVPGSVEIETDGSMTIHVCTDSNAQVDFQNAGSAGIRHSVIHYILS
jgi:hypothetical protein